MNLHVICVLAAAAAAWPAYAENSVGEPEYQSVFDDYRAYDEVELENWPKAIKQVEQIGGWRAYAREQAESNHDSPTVNLEHQSVGHQHRQGGAQ